MLKLIVVGGDGCGSSSDGTYEGHEDESRSTLGASDCRPIRDTRDQERVL